MPLYEYLCKKCGRTLEVIQTFSEPPLTVCDRCGGELTKLMSAPAVQFKGSGWYVSDYGKGGGSGAKREGGEGTAESKPEPKGDDKSEKKSETKSETKPESTSKKPDAA
jgi:putative FmdB family regulatory protein